MTIHLTILLLWPVVLALLGSFAPGRAAVAFAVVGALVPFAYAVYILFDYDTARAGLQYVTDDKWIAEMGIRYKLGVDGLNLWLIGLTTLLFLASTVWLLLRPVARPKLFALHLGIAETAVLGAFLAQDLALFVLFFDLMLVPFYFLVGQWGGPNRTAAALKMVIYTLVGSLLMLAAAVATAVLSARGGAHLTFVLSDLRQNLLPASTQRWVFVAFALAFLIKMPAFPFHGWMPDAYGNMPLPALAVFSGVVSKVAAYGFLRIALPLFPTPVHDWQTLFLVLALLSILYGSIQAFTQTNARLILGYSSVAQLGFITLGIFALDGQATGAQGALLQAVNHGLVVAPMFFIVALLVERTGSVDIRDMGGIAVRAPVLATLFLVATFATLAIPGSANFVGEFMILLGTFKSTVAVAIIASVGVVLASVYALRLYIRAMHNREGAAVAGDAGGGGTGAVRAGGSGAAVAGRGALALGDLRVRDGLVLVPLVLAIIAFALYPQQALRHGEPAVRAAVRQAAQGGPQAAASTQTASATQGATP